MATMTYYVAVAFEKSKDGGDGRALRSHRIPRSATGRRHRRPSCCQPLRSLYAAPRPVEPLATSGRVLT